MKFSFIQISDHHLGSAPETQPHRYPADRTLRTVLEHISSHHREDIDFIVSSGDLVNKANPASYAYFSRFLKLKKAAERSAPQLLNFAELSNFPIYLLPGNHDDREFFYDFLHTSPGSKGLLNFSFVHKGIQFICLDWGEETKAYAHPEMLAFLKNALASGKPSVLLTHHNLVSLGNRWPDEFLAENVQSFYDLLNEQVLGIFCGHLHSSYQRDLGNIPVFGLRSTAFQFKFNGRPFAALLPPHYRLVTINQGKLSSKIIDVPLPEDLRDRE